MAQEVEGQSWFLDFLLGLDLYEPIERELWALGVWAQGVLECRALGHCLLAVSLCYSGW